MRRRSRAGGKPVKTRPRKTATRRRGNPPKAMRGPSAISQESETTRLTREHDEALEQQTATSEVLGVISSSPTDVQPVFDLIAKSAARLCKAQFCHVFQFDGKLIHFVALHGYSAEVVKDARRGYPMAPGRGSAAARSILNGTVEEIPDIFADRDYTHGHIAKDMNYRSIVAVPMLKDDRPIGAIAIARSQTGHFPERHIDLLRTFASQAVIAIENTRLLNELRQRTADLSESLEQQTATSEVLKVISSSPGELQPVFHAMLGNATRICEASFGNLLLREGDTFRRVASHNAPPNFAAFIAKEPLIHRRQSGSLNRLIETKQADHVADMAVDEPETPIVKFGGARTLVTVPMLKENELIGAFGIYRQEVRPFTDKQIELLKNFAAQAVIAIENTRLLNELRQSLEQQTATADVLRVISSSPGELEPVFQTMLENATRICEARFGSLYLCEGDGVRMKAMHNAPPAFAQAIAQRGSVDRYSVPARYRLLHA